MRIVVTGASGNVGTAVLRRLGQDGHDLVGLARRVPDVAADGVTWQALDLTAETAVSELTRALTGADAVVHLAWGFQPTHDERQLEALGVGGTHAVLAAVRAARVQHVVHMSSIGAYSTKTDDEPVDESWSVGGISASVYSRHKVAAERLLDQHEREHDTVVTRLRPGIIGQRDAGSALLRYGLPGLVPSGLLGRIPVLPLDRNLRLPVVHADDVADAVARVLDRRAGGAFNLAADTPVTAARLAELLGARHVHLPAAVLRGLVSVSWHLRLQPIDAGWLDLAMGVPLLDTSRARAELGWQPTREGDEVLAETLEGMRDHASSDTPVLRRRTVPRAIKDFAAQGPVDERDRP